MRKFYVYALLRPGEHRPFYIGITVNPRDRRSAHARHIRQRGKPFELVVLEELATRQEAWELEHDLIAWYSQRVKLRNAPNCKGWIGNERIS